jgi:hypothetical protein
MGGVELTTPHTGTGLLLVACQAGALCSDPLGGVSQARHVSFGGCTAIPRACFSRVTALFWCHTSAVSGWSGGCLIGDSRVDEGEGDTEALCTANYRRRRLFLNELPLLLGSLSQIIFFSCQGRMVPMVRSQVDLRSAWAHEAI